MHPGDGDRDQHKQKIEKRVLLAQSDPSSGERESLISEYKLYITKIASRICHRQITAQDDEFSIALSGFDEAITRFEKGQPSTFLTFSYMVIQRRLTDFYRREQKHATNQSAIAPRGTTENDSISPEIVKHSVDQYREDERRDMTRFEVVQFTKLIERYDIKLTDLVKSSPKHKDTRRDMLDMAKAIIADKELYEGFMNKKKIGKDFAKRLGCHPRTIKRHRMYLTALVLVFVEDLPLLRQYLDLPTYKKGGG
ncbi:sigma factor [Marininema halotolerans]|uniref:sigma factor n=1 Tax=Marininema halotolerans TaxID=1155944 RepID=UPI0015961B4E|nr:sigma factor [Marininema halotolerans]